MKNKDCQLEQAASGSEQTLRQRAEEMTRGAVQLPEDMGAMSPEEAQRTLHELRVHQIELEMQNEELRQAQAELDAVRARYFDLYDLAPVGYCTISEKGLILETNLTAANLLRMARSALTKKPISRFIFREDQDIYYLNRKLLFETGVPQAFDVRMVRMDGAVFWAHIVATTALETEGTPVCRVALSDITERKQSQEALKESEERHRLLIAQMQQGLAVYEVILDKVGKAIDYRFLDVNKSFERLTGFKYENIIGRTIREIQPGIENCWIERFGRVALTGEPIQYENYSQELGKYFEEVAYSPRPKQFAVIISDVTERKKAEEDARNKMEFEARFKVLTEFFTNVSHEFKTPLSIIIAQLELMDLCLDDETKMKELIAAATQNSFRLTRLVGNILDLSKIDAGFMEARLVYADMVSVIRDICNTVDSYATARSIRLSFKTNLVRKIMPTDIEKIERIMLNLLSNAIKNTDSGGKITVRAADRRDGGVIISVEDTGVGISKEKQGIIFDRFVQVDTSLGRKTEGSGIGLALVKSLVEILQGRIEVISELGKGSNFIVALPLIQIPPDARAIDIRGFNLVKKTEMELSDLYLKT